jgi:hypothetical protein
VNKPREFWVEFGGDPSDDKEVYKRYCAAEPFKPSRFSDEVIHVIEKSAYDDQVKQADELEKLRREEQLDRQDAQDKLNIAVEIMKKAAPILGWWSADHPNGGEWTAKSYALLADVLLFLKDQETTKQAGAK